MSLPRYIRERIWSWIREHPKDAAIAAFLTIFSLTIRLYRLGEVPQDFVCDEADNYQDVILNIYGEGIPLFGYD